MTSVAIDMSGRVALVTGGGYGMGRASARRFAACGARVAVADVDEARGEETRDLIAEAGGEAIFIRADISRADDVQDMIGQVVAAYRRLDYAHNNAGIIEDQSPIHELPDDQWHRTIANNLTSVFLCLKHEIPVMLAQGGGAIVNVASETTYKGNVGDAAYTASKHGVWGLTTVAGLRYAKRNIRVNAIAPGNVRTGITERAQAVLPPEVSERMEQIQPIGRLLEPEEIAELVVWLCSDQAIAVNATRFAADTGWHVA
ncbi:SDR family NAD(P)-dependent oxidoreductase [Actinomadura sp. SCN-SB]|uniref:SDR family NAD(P)-dependent oxidoreductase n=1 Tax=Actinomadura sp. SCN-SB TaxID=3373092 RepID=UPI003752B1F7